MSSSIARATRLRRLVSLPVVAWVTVLLTFAVWATLVAGNLGTLYRVDHAGGVWAGLALSANDGTLYPPLYDGGPVGSRYMPIPIVGHAFAASLTGELLLSGRLVDLAALAAIGVLVAVLLRRGLVPWPLVGLAIAAPLLTEPGIENAVGLRHDGLSIALQLGALVAITGSRRDGVAAASGALLALAVLAKLTAVWASAAIGLWLLLRREHRPLVVAVAAGAVVLVAGVVLTNWASDGRFLAGLVGPGLGSEEPPGIGPPLPALPRLVEQMLTRTPPVALLLPLAIAGLGGLRWRDAEGLVVIATLMAALEALVIFGDRGVFGNHLLTLAVLVPLSAALTVGRGIEPLRIAAVAAVVAGIAFSFQANVGNDLRMTLDPEPMPAAAHPPLAAYVDEGVSVLSEDPGVEAFHGRMPSVVDPYMLRRVAARDPAAVDDLVARIERQEFDLVVTLFPIDSDPRWYRLYHLGERVATAITDSYEPQGFAEGYYLYRPADGS